jgi:hypothetical protein
MKTVRATVTAARQKLGLVRFQRAAARAFGAWGDTRHPDLMIAEDVARHRTRLHASTNRRIRRRAKHG